MGDVMIQQLQQAYYHCIHCMCRALYVCIDSVKDNETKATTIIIVATMLAVQASLFLVMNGLR